MEPLTGFLQAKALGGLLSWRDQTEAAQMFGAPLGEVERVALENELLPSRYQRNRQMISCRQQLRLFTSVVTVVGCGGLGGYIIEELARLGIGHIIAIDPDVFEENNLNRQLLSSPFNLGMSKVQAAADRVAQINPAVTLTPMHEEFDREGGTRLLRSADIAVDGLDSIPVRLDLAAACRDIGIPIVHGAIAGWYGQVATQFPGDRSLEILYQREKTRGRGIEKGLGNPSFTPAIVASLEVTEVCKVLLCEGESLRGRTLSIDLREMEFMEAKLEADGSGRRAGTA